MDVEYWKQRALLAEQELERLGSIETPPSKPVFDIPASDMEAAAQILASSRAIADEPLEAVARRLVGFAADRTFTAHVLRTAGYQVDDAPDNIIAIKPVVAALLVDLQSGRSTIDFLSKPLRMAVESLPVATVFVHEGRLLEVKRVARNDESTIVCYQWNRDERPFAVDRAQFVAPIGKMLFDDRRKQIQLGLLDLQTSKPSLPLESDVPLLER